MASSSIFSPEPNSTVIVVQPVDVDIVSPLDGAGNVKVAVENTPAVTVSGDVTVVQPTGADLHVDVDNFPATQPVSGIVDAIITGPLDGGDVAVKVENFPATQPVSGSVGLTDSTKATYVSTFNIVAASPGATFDFFQLIGSATKTVKIRRYQVSVFANSFQTSIQITATRRSTTDTGLTNFSGAPNDPTNPVATAIPGNGTSSALGVAVAVLGITQLCVPVFPTGNALQAIYVRDYDAELKQPIVLRGNSDFFCLGSPGPLAQTLNYKGSVEWTEE